jgi:hypothetical protein
MEKIIEAIYELRGIKDRAGVNEPSEIVKKVMLKLGMNFNFFIFLDFYNLFILDTGKNYRKIR